MVKPSIAMKCIVQMPVAPMDTAARLSQRAENHAFAHISASRYSGMPSHSAGPTSGSERPSALR